MVALGREVNVVPDPKTKPARRPGEENRGQMRHRGQA